MSQASAENWDILGVPTRKEWIHRHKRAVGKYARVAFAKKKRNPAVCIDHQVVRCERVKVSESRTLARKGGFVRDHGENKGGFHSEGRQLSRRRGSSGKENFLRSGRKHKR